MAHVTQLPVDGDGMCMMCKEQVMEGEMLTCKTCFSPWHARCLAVRPETLASTLDWECPDCSSAMHVEGDGGAPVAPLGASGELIAAIRAIEADTTLTEREKGSKRQRLLSGTAHNESCDDEGEMSKRKGKNKVEDGSEVLELVGKALNCSFCIQLPERPVTTPCGHNFCLKCFKKWISQGKNTCAKCRAVIPHEMANQPRINSGLVLAIRMAKLSKTNVSMDPDKIQYFIHNQNRPDKAYATEKAKKAGKANAASGRIFVTTPADHFGPILAENDPERRQGVLVGEWWSDRMECRQWGVHLPHVAGICGQSKYGAQSVVLSGGYEDDEDNGDWFLYTGSGGRDLTGNKRTNKKQSFDQKFTKSNEALRVSCEKGYPVRVVRSYKDKRSSYAPEKGYRYDGIYRIEKCWRKVGKQGFLVCRYLFVRCDNSPAPWTSDEHGDKVRALPVISELNNAIDITDRNDGPSWDYDVKEGHWTWKKPPPKSNKKLTLIDPVHETQEKTIIRKAQATSLKERILKELGCFLCANVMKQPVTTPCGHNFCKSCLEAVFAGQTFVKERKCLGGRTLRSQKNVMKCPCCATDISEFLVNPQVNRELMELIEGLQQKTQEEGEDNVKESGEGESDLMPRSPDFSSAMEEEDDENKLKRKRNDASASTEQQKHGDAAGNDNVKDEAAEAVAVQEGLASASTTL